MAASPAAATGTVPSTPGLDLYMTARVADRDGAVAQAAAGYAAALAASPDNPVVALRAYREAIRAGDLDLADRAAAVLAAHHAAPADAPTVDRRAPVANLTPPSSGSSLLPAGRQTRP